MKIQRAMKIASAGTLETGIANKTGVFGVSYSYGGVHYSAMYALYDAAGTPTTVLLTSGAGTYFSITETTGSKVNVYWKTDELEIENNSGYELQITLEGDFYNI